MHHRRHRPKKARAGCLLCKPWKRNGVRTDSRYGERWSDHRRRWVADQDAARPLKGGIGATAGGGRGGDG